MRKIILQYKEDFLAILVAWLIWMLIVPTAFAASYYGCAGAAINADSTFCTTATGSCAGETPVTAATALAGTHSLFANGCTITIPENVTITASKLSNKDDGGAMVDGGQFTVVTTGWTNPTVIQAAIETGGTTGAALGISGNGNLNPVLTIGSSGTPVTVTGGSASSMNGVTDSHSVGTVVVYADLAGGSSAAAYGYAFSGTSGAVSFIGNSTGANSQGINMTNAGTGTIAGNCIGSDTGNVPGCQAASTGALTVTGSIINGDRGVGAQGKIIWAPSNAQKYVLFDGAGTALYASAGLGSDVGGTQITGANTAAEVAVGTYFVKKDDGVYTQGTASSGGGAWGF